MLAGATLSAAVLTFSPPATLAGASGMHEQTVHVSTDKVSHVGTVLTTSAGLTLYYFEKDPVGMATCAGACANIWPPYLVATGSHVEGPKGVKGLSLINVGGGHAQVAFHDHALYRFSSDSKKGEAKGQGFAGVWFVALKSGIPAMHATPAAGSPSTTTSKPTTTTTAGGGGYGY
jgi:predicted lipoprotein with Yx(FWY)xxD motif